MIPTETSKVSPVCRTDLPPNAKRRNGPDRLPLLLQYVKRKARVGFYCGIINLSKRGRLSTSAHRYKLNTKDLKYGIFLNPTYFLWVLNLQVKKANTIVQSNELI